MPASSRTMVRKSAPKRIARKPAPLSRKEQGEKTRRAILDAAIALYAESGFRGTGLIAIGQRAGVHHATVLYHYKTSRELLLAVLQERDRLFMEFSGPVVQDGGLEALRQLPFVGHFNVKYPVWAKLFAVLQAENFDRAGEAHDYFLQRRFAARDLTVKLLRNAKKRGEIRQDADEVSTVNTILAFTAGINMQTFLDPKNVDVVAAYERFTEMLITDLTRGIVKK